MALAVTAPSSTVVAAPLLPAGAVWLLDVLLRRALTVLIFLPPAQAHQYAASSARRAEPEGGSGSSAAGRDDDEQRAKYIKRANPLKRTLQRLFPAWFAPTLPVTTRCALQTAVRLVVSFLFCLEEGQGAVGRKLVICYSRSPHSPCCLRRVSMDVCRDIQEDGRTPMGAKKKRRVRSGIMDVRAVVGLVLLLGIMFIVYRQFKLLG